MLKILKMRINSEFPFFTYWQKSQSLTISFVLEREEMKQSASHNMMRDYFLKRATGNKNIHAR
jgi:hypothetical protein